MTANKVDAFPNAGRLKLTKGASQDAIQYARLSATRD
jgi:hypothetical protein